MRTSNRQPFPWSLLYGTFVGACLATLVFMLLTPRAGAEDTSPTVRRQLEALRHEVMALRVEVGELKRQVSPGATTARR